jgi:hypothetical protein
MKTVAVTDYTTFVNSVKCDDNNGKVPATIFFSSVQNM